MLQEYQWMSLSPIPTYPQKIPAFIKAWQCATHTPFQEGTLYPEPKNTVSCQSIPLCLPQLLHPGHVLLKVALDKDACSLEGKL